MQPGGLQKGIELMFPILKGLFFPGVAAMKSFWGSLLQSPRSSISSSHFLIIKTLRHKWTCPNRPKQNQKTEPQAFNTDSEYLSSCNLLYCLPKSRQVGLQPTIWSGLQRPPRHRCVSLSRLLTQKTSSKPKPQNNLFLRCKTKQSIEGRQHPPEKSRDGPWTNRWGRGSDLSTGSQYLQGTSEPWAKGPSRLLSWTCLRWIRYRPRFILPDPQAVQNTEMLRFAAKKGCICKATKQGDCRTTLKYVSPKARGLGYLWDEE